MKTENLKAIFDIRKSLIRKEISPKKALFEVSNIKPRSKKESNDIISVKAIAEIFIEQQEFRNGAKNDKKSLCNNRK